MGFITAGPVAVDQITNFVIPITLRHFTANASLIAFIVATNRLFGFLVQPYVAWKSDHIQTRFGRRRPYFLAGIPATTACMLFVGAMPFIFPSDTVRHTMPVLILLVGMNVLMQAFQDVIWGSQEPLYADTFKQRMLGRAVAVRTYIMQIVMLSMTYGALKLADVHEFLPYVVCATWMALSWINVALFIREKPLEVMPIKERYNPFGHIGLLFKNADYARIAAISGLWLVLLAVFGLYLSLFATETLELTKAQFGTSLLIGPIVAFLCSWPAGYLTDRFGPKPVLFTGFFMLLVVGVCMAFLIQPNQSVTLGVYKFTQFHFLMVLLTAFSVSGVLMNLPMTPLVFQYAAPDERGKVFGLIQFVRGFSAFVFSMILGYVVGFVPSSDPTPILDRDIPSASAFLQRLEEPDTPMEEFILANLSEEVRGKIGVEMEEGTEEYNALRQQLAADLTRIARREESLYEPEWFEGVEHSKVSLRYIKEPPSTPNGYYLFNRALLHDAFPEDIARKINYRVAYVLVIILSALACMLTLTARRGKYADTLRDREHVEL